MKKHPCLWGILICQGTLEEESMYVSDDWRPDGQFAIKVPANADSVWSSQYPMWYTSRHNAKNYESYILMLLSIGLVDSMKTTEMSIVHPTLSLKLPSLTKRKTWEELTQSNTN